MTKKYSTKRALIASVLLLALCFTALVGTTFAWFTDSATSTGNIIKTGTLDVEMYWADGTEAVPTEDEGWTDASTGAIFNYDKWEPGYVQVRHIKIANVGTLALKYKVNIIANGEVTDLADVIDVYYVDPAVQVSDRAQLTESNKLGTLTEVLAALGETGNGELAAGASDTITIAFKMQETAGNDYKNKSIGTDFSVQLVATQLAAEEDSFDNQYDVDADYPNVSVPVAIPEVATDSIALSFGGMTVEVPADVVNSISDDVTSVSLAYTNPVVDTVNNTVTYSSVELVDQDGKAIDLSSNTTDLTVTLPAGGIADGTEVAIYHDGEFVTYATVVDGYITYNAAHFCEISINSVVSVTTFEDLQAAVNAGEHVVLANDIAATNNAALVVPADTSAILDLNGHTYTSKDGGSGNWMAIYVNDGATLVLEDSVGTGKIVSSCYGVYVKVGAKFVMNGGELNVSGNGTYDIAVILWNGEFVMNAGSINAQYAVWASNYYRDSVAQYADAPNCSVTIAEGCTVVSTGYADVEIYDAPDTVVSVPESLIVYKG